MRKMAHPINGRLLWVSSRSSQGRCPEPRTDSGAITGSPNRETFLARLTTQAYACQRHVWMEVYQRYP